jgi:hypothetical protein
MAATNSGPASGGRVASGGFPAGEEAATGPSGRIAEGTLAGDRAARFADADGAPRAPVLLLAGVVTLRPRIDSAGDLSAGGSTRPVGLIGAGISSTAGLIVVGVGGG